MLTKLSECKSKRGEPYLRSANLVFFAVPYGLFPETGESFPVPCSLHKKVTSPKTLNYFFCRAVTENSLDLAKEN